MSRRAFFKTAAGMAAAFVAMNETYGPIFAVSRAEAETPWRATSARRRSKISSSWTCTRIFCATTLGSRPSSPSARPWVSPAGTRRSREGADARRPQVRELLQGGLPRQRYQGRVHQRLAVGRPAGLVPDQRDEVRRAREDQPEAGTKRMFSHAMMTPGWDGLAGRRRADSRSSSPIRSRATRSAITPTSTCPSIRTGSTTRRSCIPSTSSL